MKYIDKLSPVINELINKSNFWIKKTLIEKVLNEVGEN